MANNLERLRILLLDQFQPRILVERRAQVHQARARPRLPRRTLRLRPVIVAGRIFAASADARASGAPRRRLRRGAAKWSWQYREALCRRALRELPHRAGVRQLSACSCWSNPNGGVERDVAGLIRIEGQRVPSRAYRRRSGHLQAARPKPACGLSRPLLPGSLSPRDIPSRY